MSLAEKSFGNGEVIIKEGDTGRSFFRILEGKASVYADYGKKDPFRLAVLEAGEYFGEMAIIEAYPRSATVIAVGSVRVVEIPESDMDAYFAQNPDQIFELIKHLGSRVQSMTNDYNDAKALLKEVRESDAGKNMSLFSKIKKHINLYQYNKNKMPEASEETRQEPYVNYNDGTGNVREYRKGLIICKEGDADNSMFILHRGEIGFYNNYRRRGDEVEAGKLSAVSVFGEMGLIAGEARPATAVSESDDTVVEVIRQDELEEIFRTNPAKIDLILRQLSFRLRKLTHDFMYACKDITETYNDK